MSTTKQNKTARLMPYRRPDPIQVEYPRPPDSRNPYYKNPDAILEIVSQETGKIFHIARQLYCLGYGYVWVYKGNIFIKKSIKHPTIYIKDEAWASYMIEKAKKEVQATDGPQPPLNNKDQDTGK